MAVDMMAPSMGYGLPVHQGQQINQNMNSWQQQGNWQPGQQTHQQKPGYTPMSYYRQYFAELLGSVVFGTIALGVASAFPLVPGNADTALLAIGLSFGLGLYAALEYLGWHSGGHYNPGITIANMLVGQIGWFRAIVYIIMQVAGFLAAGGFVKWFTLPLGGTYGAAVIAPGFSTFRALALESFGSVVLISVALTAGRKQKNGSWTSSNGAAAIATTLAGLVILGGSITGGAYNAARWFGAAAVANTFTDWWVYLVANLAVGPLFAAIFYWGHSKCCLEQMNHCPPC